MVNIYLCSCFTNMIEGTGNRKGKTLLNILANLRCFQWKIRCALQHKSYNYIKFQVNLITTKNTDFNMIRLTITKSTRIYNSLLKPLKQIIANCTVPWSNKTNTKLLITWMYIVNYCNLNWRQSIFTVDVAPDEVFFFIFPLLPPLSYHQYFLLCQLHNVIYIMKLVRILLNPTTSLAT